MKSISLTSSNIKSVSIERDIDVVVITVVGVGIDSDGNEYPVENLVRFWGDLPQSVQNTADNFLKHMSREFNNMVSAEDSETW